MLFSQEDYSVTIHGETIQLLRKEFHLLAFLYKSHNRAFTREEILDAVWPMEEPTDRTVDDHIYLLRKKLSPFSHFVQIKTVKGYGYLLEVYEKNEENIPENLVKQTEQLFSMYYQYGYGKPLKSLLTNKQLGFSQIKKHQMVLCLLNSDFHSLLEQAIEIEKTFLLLFLYGFIEEDGQQVIDLYKKVLDRDQLDDKDKMDLEYVNLPLLYLKVDQPKIAMEYVQKGLLQTNNDETHGYFPLLTLMCAIIYLYLGEMNAAKKMIRKVEEVLAQIPFKREEGALYVVKGCLKFAEGDKEEGRELVEKGRSIIQNSGHTYYFLFIYAILDCLLPKTASMKNLIEFYKQEKEAYFRQTRLFQLKDHILNEIRSL